MVLVTLFILLMLNAVVIKAYSEYIEHELEDSIEGVMDEDGLEELPEGYSIRRNEFIRNYVKEKQELLENSRKYGKVKPLKIKISLE